MAFTYNVGRPNELPADILALEQDILKSARMADFYAKNLEDLNKKAGLKEISTEALNGMFSDALKKLIEWVKKFCEQVTIWCKKLYGRSVILASKFLDRNRLSTLVKKNLTSDEQKEFGTVLVHTLKDDAVRSFQRAALAINSKVTGFPKRVLDESDEARVVSDLYDTMSVIIGVMTPMFFVLDKDGNDVNYTKDNAFTRIGFCSKSAYGRSSDDEFFEDRTGFSVARINQYESVIELIYKAETSFCSESNTLVKSGTNKLHKLQREAESSGEAPNFDLIKKQLLACAYAEKAAISACDQMAGVIYDALNQIREQLMDKFPNKNWGVGETDTAGGSTQS